MIEEFQQFGRDLYLTGLVSSHTGAMSAREEERLFVTRRGAMLGHLTADDIIEFGVEEAAPAEAPEDVAVHQAIFRATDAKAVIYARPPWTMALALVEDRLSPANGEGAEALGSAPVLITQRAITSPDVSQLIGRILRDNRVVALRGHGVLARGDSLSDALRVLSLLEEMCKVVHLYRSLAGDEPQVFVRDRQPASISNAKNGGAPRRAPTRTGPPRQQPPSNGGGGGNWRREEGPAPRRGPNDRQPSSGPPRRSGGGGGGAAPHR